MSVTTKYSIGTFFASVIGSCLGMVMTFVLIISTLVWLAFNVLENYSESEPNVSENGQVLLLNFNKPIVEKADYNPLEELDLPFNMGASQLGINQIREGLLKAANDKNIKGVFLRIENPSAGYAKLNEIKHLIDDFKLSSGKQVVAYGESMSEKAYYLACSANKIYITPVGSLDFKGLSTELLFFKGLFEKLDIEPRIFRVGKFKSAVEPFMLSKMSDENRMQVQQFLEEILSENLKAEGESRNIRQATLRTLSDGLVIRDLILAEQHGLIDGAKYYDEVMTDLYTELSIKMDEELLSFSAYIEKSLDAVSISTSPKIAVVVAEGEITSGGSKRNESIGSSSFNSTLQKAVEDSSIKAIVLRINSPGGSALASDVMWREIKLASKIKPVVCSMSDVAASGGYYMAMACDYIYAYPNTITGSIGVFGLSVELEGFLNKKLGITTDKVVTGKYSDLGSPLHQLKEEEFSIIQEGVERIYEDFTKKAAESRKMSHQDLKEIASGRVWSGVKAKEIGLVDELGDLDDAILKAATLASIEIYDILYFPKNKNIYEQITGDIETKLESNVFNSFEAGNQLKKSLEYIQSLDKVQARMPYDLLID